MKYTNYLDWKPVVRSLFQHLSLCDLLPLKVHDGDSFIAIDAQTEYEQQEQAVDAVTSVDMSHVTCYWRPADRGPRLTTLLIVLGNEPWETVADYTWSRDCEGIEEQLEVALDAFQREWEGRPCPTVIDEPEDDKPWTETEQAAYNGLSSVEYHNPL